MKSKCEHPDFINEFHGISLSTVGEWSLSFYLAQSKWDEYIGYTLVTICVVVCT